MDGPTGIFISSSSILIAQIVNFAILGAIMALSCWIGWDARRRGLSWMAVIGWATLTLFMFPIGLGLYLLLEKRNSKKRRLNRDALRG